jgi:hypothetical protein
LSMEEGLLLDGVAKNGVHIPVGSVQFAAAIEPDLAHTGEAGRNGAPVPASEALDAVGAVEHAVEFRFPGLFGELFRQARHDFSCQQDLKLL